MNDDEGWAIGAAFFVMCFFAVTVLGFVIESLFGPDSGGPWVAAIGLAGTIYCLGGLVGVAVRRS